MHVVCGGVAFHGSVNIVSKLNIFQHEMISMYACLVFVAI